jgi:transposase
MIDYTTWMQMQRMHEQRKLNAAQIARELSLAPRTVRTWLGQPYRLRKTARRESKLDQYKGLIMGWLQQHRYTAVQILALLREEGFDGGITIVKDYIQQVRPRHTEAYLTITFAPGECAQVDWGSWEVIEVGNTRRRLSFFVMVLGYSRMMYVEFTLGQSQEYFLSCHQHAFEFFGGVPEKVMCDNCKTAILSHPRGMKPIVNRQYADFAAHYGFEVVACNVGKGNEKGIVENAVGYVKHNFLAGRPVTEFASLNPAIRLWMDHTANIRIHGRTRQRPTDLFLAEKPSMKTLPVHSYDCALIRHALVNVQFRVHVDGNRYSVPAKYVGQKLLLKLYADRICLYDGEELVTEHLRSYERGRDFELQEHVKPVLERKRRANEHEIYKRFLAISPRAEVYSRQLAERKPAWRHHLRKIMALAEIYGVDKIARALDDALEYEAFGSEYIANILEQRERRLPDPGPLNLIRKEDQLEIELPDPDLSIYNEDEGDEDTDETETNE